MFFIARPTPHVIERFIDRSRGLRLSYDPVGILREETGRRDVVDAVVAIGRGHEDFARARDALRHWKQFDIGWVELFSAGAPPVPGSVAAVLIRHFGFWSLNGCRVVYAVADRDDRFGFAYGTLTNHAEAGEEIFEVFLDRQSSNVMYRIRAVSWPHAMLARLGQPLVRMLQARFRRDSAEAMKRAVRQAATPAA